MDLGLLGKTVLVLAGSKGLGYAAAKELANEGCNVVITSSNKDNLDLAVHNIEQETGYKVLSVVSDINKEKDLLGIYDFIINKFGKLDVLINNCGGPHSGFFESLTKEDWEFGYSQVLKSAAFMIKLALPGMKERGWGRIINITSVSALQPIDNLILSNTFRAGLTGMTKTLSTQYAKTGVTLNNVAPGYTLTGRISELIKKRSEQNSVPEDLVLDGMVKDIPMGRMAEPKEIAAGICFLASERASYITGITLHIDGGYIKGLF